jgi:hypothetical protein
MKPLLMKYCFLLLILIIPVIHCSAQWGFGGRAGINMCKTTGQMDDAPEYYKSYIYWLPGPVVFGVFEYRFNKFLSILGELGYATIGNESISLYDEFVPYSRNYSYKKHYNCAQTGALVKVKVDCKWFDSYFITGPYFLRIYGGRGVVDDGHEKKIYDFDPIGPGYNQYLSDSILCYYRTRNYNFGVNGGAGVEKKIGRGKLGLDFRFGITLLDMMEFSEGGTRKQLKEYGYVPFRSMNFSITLVYLFYTGVK